MNKRVSDIIHAYTAANIATSRSNFQNRATDQSRPQSTQFLSDSRSAKDEQDTEQNSLELNGGKYSTYPMSV